MTLRRKDAQREPLGEIEVNAREARGKLTTIVRFYTVGYSSDLWSNANLSRAWVPWRPSFWLMLVRWFSIVR